MRYEPQDIVGASKFLPDTEAIFRAKKFKILQNIGYVLAKRDV